MGSANIALWNFGVLFFARMRERSRDFALTPFRDCLKALLINSKIFPRKGRIFALRNPALSGEVLEVLSDFFQEVTKWGAGQSPATFSAFFPQKSAKRHLQKEKNMI